MRRDTGRMLRAISTMVVLMTFFALAFAAQKEKPSKNAEAADPSAGVKLQPMNVKPGLWETTMTMTVAGEMPIPPGTLDQLTPEQRARVEARMKANSAGNTNTHTDKSCVTKEDLEKFKSDFGARGNGCSPTIISSTSSSAKAKISCETQGLSGTGTYEVEALDSEHLKGSSHATMTSGGHTMNMDGKFTSKWLGSSCEGIK